MARLVLKRAEISKQLTNTSKSQSEHCKLWVFAQRATVPSLRFVAHLTELCRPSLAARLQLNVQGACVEGNDIGAPRSESRLGPAICEPKQS